MRTLRNAKCRDGSVPPSAWATWVKFTEIPAPLVRSPVTFYLVLGIHPEAEIVPTSEIWPIVQGMIPSLPDSLRNKSAAEIVDGYLSLQPRKLAGDRFRNRGTHDRIGADIYAGRSDSAKDSPAASLSGRSAARWAENPYLEVWVRLRP